MALAGLGTAHAATQPALRSRTEMFLTVGQTHPIDTQHILSTPTDWPQIRVGAGYRASPMISIGATVSWASIGALGITYFPPGSDFQSATESASMIPISAYVAMRLGRISGVRPYVSARAGTYTVLTHADPAGAPEFTRTRPGLGAALGISGDEARFAPILELAYEARSNASSELLPAGWLHMITLSLGLRFQQ
jgi:hypothetical protein